ncbi:MAG: hypothetical protein ABI680_16200 [Chthoniobacteraceae bacterium]
MKTFPHLVLAAILCVLASSARAGGLEDLAWFVGTWKAQFGGETTVSWMTERSFLRVVTSIPIDSGKFEVTEVIGYDAIEKTLRSWTFDSLGNFGEGVMRQDGDRWITTMKIKTRDGTKGGSENVLTKVDDGKLTWASRERDLGGQDLPAVDAVEFKRVEASQK